MDFQPQYKTPSTFCVYQKRPNNEPAESAPKMKYAGGKIAIPDYTYDKKEIGDRFMPFKETPTARLFPLGDMVYAVVSYFNQSVVLNIRFYIDSNTGGGIKPSTPGATLWGSDIDYALDLFPLMLARPRETGQEIVSHPVCPGPMHVVLGKDCGDWIFAIKKLYKTDKDTDYITSSSRGINLTLEQFEHLCDHVEAIRATLIKFRQNLFSGPSAATGGAASEEHTVENICRVTTALAIKSTFPPDSNLNDKDVIKEQVELAMEEFKLSELLAICFDRNKSGLADVKMITVENVLKKLYTKQGRNDLINTICQSV